jgi:hypothetical protein
LRFIADKGCRARFEREPRRAGRHLAPREYCRILSGRTRWINLDGLDYRRLRERCR